MTYLNVDEVETALTLAAGPANAGFTELIPLPHLTWERRTCHAIRVHSGAPARGGVYLLGGVHAREWGSCDVLVTSSSCSPTPTATVRVLRRAARPSPGTRFGSSWTPSMSWCFRRRIPTVATTR